MALYITVGGKKKQKQTIFSKEEEEKHNEMTGERLAGLNCSLIPIQIEM